MEEGGLPPAPAWNRGRREARGSGRSGRACRGALRGARDRPEPDHPARVSSEPDSARARRPFRANPSRTWRPLCLRFGHRHSSTPRRSSTFPLRSKSQPAVEPEPEFIARPSVPEAEYFLEPVPAPLPLDETPETFWRPVTPFPLDDQTDFASAVTAAFDDTEPFGETGAFEDSGSFEDSAPYEPDPFEAPEPYELHPTPATSFDEASFDAAPFDPVSFEPVSFEPEPEPEVHTPALEWRPLVPRPEPVAEVAPELARPGRTRAGAGTRTRARGRA